MVIDWLVLQSPHRDVATRGRQRRHVRALVGAEAEGAGSAIGAQEDTVAPAAGCVRVALPSGQLRDGALPAVVLAPREDPPIYCNGRGVVRAARDVGNLLALREGQELPRRQLGVVVHHVLLALVRVVAELSLVASAPGEGSSGGE